MTARNLSPHRTCQLLSPCRTGRVVSPCRSQVAPPLVAGHERRRLPAQMVQQGRLAGLRQTDAGSNELVTPRTLPRRMLHGESQCELGTQASSDKAEPVGTGTDDIGYMR